MDGTTTHPAIEVRGARVHNLKDLSVTIPRDKLVVLTGVSGSGKSSLAFDTLHAEGQRRYMEGLSAFSRQFLDQLEPPDVDAIDGLPPTVAIDQKSGSASPRSTVGTLTEIHDYLRLLFARAGLPHCPKCGQPIRRQSPDQMVESVMALGDGKKVIVLAPLVRGRKGAHADSFATIRREGLLRARVDGEMIEIGDEPPKLAKTKTHTIEAVMDRLVVREGVRPRLSESIDRALKLGEGTVILAEPTDAGGWSDRILSVHFACPECGVGLEEIEPRTFSFNSPYGACPECTGLGTIRQFDVDAILLDRSKRFEEAIAIALLAEVPGLKLAVPKPLQSKPLAKLSSSDFATVVESLLKQLELTLEFARTERARSRLEAFRQDVPCPLCQGARLRLEALAVTLRELSIHQVCALLPSECITFFKALKFEPHLEKIAPPLCEEIVERIEFLERVGLDYLTLDRAAPSLSGGEFQRVRLASQISSGLVGVCYVLDEPTSGLHPRDTSRLLESLRLLRDAGNTVLVVEHDHQVIEEADWLIDLGPGAGPDGGRLLAEGTPDSFRDASNSITAQFLHAEPTPPNRETERLNRSKSRIEIEGASEHNLKAVSVDIPLGCMTCVTGVSGSGKSTLVQEILAPAVRRHLGFGGPRPGSHVAIKGLEQIQSLVDVDQSPIGRSPRSTPATFLGVFDEIRALFAKTKEAKIRGYGAARFSFNAKDGRCERCQGLGSRKLAMQFLPDLFVTCDVCKGLRYNQPTLEVRYRGLSIGDVLGLRVDEALNVFEAIPKIRRGIAALHEAGLGYVTLGQPANTLSGGESQRVKLAAGLNRAESENSLYILDEPTTGLHAADVSNLLRVLIRLADRGNTLVIIEHNLEVVRAADWVIDLGPAAGPAGGQVIATGTPWEVSRNPSSITGPLLQSNGR